ncbi:MAG: carboxy terminal-processing peptidase [Chitinophagales bacterium]|nr:carboxy terminal-processing peptidase [Chitinophagales bacterium]
MSSIHKKRFTRILLVVSLLLCILYFSFARLRTPETDNQQLLGLIIRGFSEVHYAPQPVDDSFSEKIFLEFLMRIDFNKKAFTKQDVISLDQYRKTIDDQINAGSFEFFNEVMKIYKERMNQAYRYSKLPLESPISFDIEENLETDGEKLSYAADSNALKDEWRKYMKLQVLQQLNDEEERQQKAKAKSDTVKIKSFEQLESESRAKVNKSNEEFFSRVSELEENDWMAIYLNCISNIEDPHSEYFPPVQKQNFDIQLSGQLEGIGAQLQQRDGDIKIMNIVPGSASWREGQLKANDVILKVAQGNQEPVNVEGMRLDKAIQLIRGKKGTEVRLTVKKPDGSILTVPIIRDIVVLEATYAQSAIINSGESKIGYIRLPEFYLPMGQEGGRSSAADVEKELKKLKAEGVAGIILDLRDNGGGSLQEAVKIGGLFISQGPVVQVRPRSGKPNVMYDSDPSVVYDGPLTIMVNGSSASASEIVAAAMQDYHRGVIIGSNTFGKGTVQNIFNLDNFASRSANGAPALGSLKITIQKFYRINGNATQLKGVIPDVILPDPYAEIPSGEKEDKYAIGWDEITKAGYESLRTNFDIASLKVHSEKRTSSSTPFQLIDEQANDYKLRSKQSSYSLNYKKFSEHQKELDAKQKKYDAITADTALVAISNLMVDMAKVNSDSTRVERNNQFLKNLRKDVYLDEAAKIVLEMQ